jgi:hypothetical protein
MAYPWTGPSATTLRISRSSVPYFSAIGATISSEPSWLPTARDMPGAAQL